MMLGSRAVYFFEEGLRSGGTGERAALELLERGYRGTFRLTAVPDEFVAQATVKEQLKAYDLDVDGIYRIIRDCEAG